MAFHESCKSRLVSTADESFQQLPIGQPRSVAQNRLAKVRDDLADLAGCHVVSLVRASAALYLITTRSRLVDAFFSDGRETC
jgi:hypothetical protein